jgi:hypothetical protein
MTSRAYTILATCAAFALLAVVLPAQASAQTAGAQRLQPSQRETQTRTVERDGWTISFSSTWFTATKGDKTVSMDDFLYRESMDCMEWLESGRMMSIVGTIVTFEWSMYAYCGGAHGWADTRYITTDLNQDADEVSPSDIFGSSALESALAESPVWQYAQKNGGVYQCVLMHEGNTVRGRFAFHHVKDGRVAVRIGVGEYLSEACRGELTQLSLQLPIPEGLAKELEQAAEEKTMMEDLYAPGESC